MPGRRQTSAAFTLVELLIVIALMGIVAALALPSLSPAIHDQLEGAAQVISHDLAYARGLAVANNSSYRLTFDFSANQYVLRHSGANPALDSLPANPFQAPGGDPTQYVVSLDELAMLGGQVQLAAVGTTGARPSPQTDLEFGPLGATVRRRSDRDLAARRRRRCAAIYFGKRKPGHRTRQRRRVHRRRPPRVVDSVNHAWGAFLTRRLNFALDMNSRNH